MQSNHNKQLVTCFISYTSSRYNVILFLRLKLADKIQFGNKTLIDMNNLCTLKINAA